jgi:hypothetical protein
VTPALSNTIVYLERAAVAVTRIWIQDMYFKSPFDLGAVPVQCSVYEGHVPMLQVSDENSVPKAPSIAVRVQNASWKREHGEAQLNWAIITWNDDLSRIGFRDVENLAWRINQGLYESVGIPLVMTNSDGSYTLGTGNLFQLLDHPTNFELIDDPTLDFFPFFIGVFSAHFGIPTAVPDTAPWNQFADGTFNVTTPTPPAPTPHPTKLQASQR